MYSGNSYKKFPHFYDILYKRYLKSVPEFVALIVLNTPKKGDILDLAAGTGEVSIPLLKKGFTVVSADLNKGMLRELRKKAKISGVKNVRAASVDMGKIGYKEKFDTVCVRQAINYFLGERALAAGVKNIFKALKPGGKFIFNAPNYKGQKKYPDVSNIYSSGAQNAFVLETNEMRGRLLKHRQYSLVWGGNSKPDFIIDENSFYMFAKKDLEKALKRAGFSKAEFSGSDKTLYCVATK